MGPERGKKGDFAIFWPFFAIWGWIVNPHGPSSCFALLSLTATLLVTNSRKVSTTRNKNFSFFCPFLVFLVMCSAPAPPGQMSPPGERPWGHPLVISVFSPLFSISAVGFIAICTVKLNLRLKVIFFLAEVKLPDLSHFEPFLPFLPGLRGQCAPLARLANPQT